jgi:hypothetical protein
MKTQNSLLRPLADTAELSGQGRSKRTSSILPTARAIMLAVLMALLDALQVSGQGIFDLTSPDPAILLLPRGFSGNGTAAVGAAVSFDNYGPVPRGQWYWSPSRGMVSLPDGLFTWLDYISDAAGPEKHLSGNGQVAVGVRRLPSTDDPLFGLWRWSPDGSSELIGPVPYQVDFAYASSLVVNHVSYDGSTIVGTLVSSGMDGQDFVSFRWSKAGGFTRLDPAAYVVGASRDGDVVLCRTLTGSALIWNANGGVIPLPPELAMFQSARLSEDGKVVVGAGWSDINLQNFLWRWSPAASVEFLNLPANYADRAQFIVSVSGVSANGRTVAGVVGPWSTGLQYFWTWTDFGGFQVLPSPAGDNSGYTMAVLSSDGTTIWGQNAADTWRWTAADGLHYLAQDLQVLAPSLDSAFYPVYGSLASLSSDGSVIAVSSGYSSWLAAYRPVIETLSPNRATAGQGDVPITIYGIGFKSGTSVFIGSTELSTTYVGPTELQATIPSSALVASGDFSTLPVTVHGPTGAVSLPVGFTVMASGIATEVSEMQTVVATSGTTASVAIEPTSSADGGISATLTVSGEESATVTVATYNADPSASGNTSFEVAGQFLDLNASGVTATDSMRVYFYYPAGTPTETLSLKFWNTHVTPAAWENVTPATIDPALHRIGVVFDANSHPKITELDGTFFAPAVASPIQFIGFLSPLGGADATGGSFTSPLRTFKAGSTIPVKFAASQSGAPVTAGTHTIQVIKYSSATTAGTPIDATPQAAATTGNQFRFSDGTWQFNLDTKSTGITKGIWQLAATLSDGSQHKVWVQIK